MSDEHNALHAASEASVDALNAAFYGTIRYPWPPSTLDRLEHRGFWARLLAQDVGRWDSHVLPDAGAEVWVAGCGTNQALITALRFPDAAVVGSDLSAESLELCGRNAGQLGVANLELRRESLNAVAYRERFDHVICTGVIHHNAVPAATLAHLASGLKPAGILELMVYNRYHRQSTTAVQKAVQILGEATPGTHDLAAATRLARRLLQGVRVGSATAALLGRVRDLPEAAFADALLQPVEYSYTVESLTQMAASCGLEVLLPCVDAYSKAAGRTSWNLELEDPELEALYLGLPDARRWHVTNLLLGEESPLLWFYLQRRDSPHPRRSEAEICEDFLRARFVGSKTTRTVYVRAGDGTYRKGERPLPFPRRPKDPLAQQVFEALDPEQPIGGTLARLGLPVSFPVVNRLRIHLTTTAFPFLQVC